MLTRIGIALALVSLNVLIHTGCTAVILSWLNSRTNRNWARRTVMSRAVGMGAIVFLMMVVAYVEAGVWAGFYLFSGEFTNVNEAIYFSLVTFTTLGYGDITLSENWRVMSAFEATNGVLMLGWTTALIVAVGQRLFLSSPPASSSPSS